jgi:hypothetical protein
MFSYLLFRKIRIIPSLFVLVLLGLTGCQLPDKETDSPPIGSLVLLHQSSMLPELEIFVDGALLTSLNYGEISDAFDLDAIDHEISFRFSGAAEDFATTELITFYDQQVHVIALSGTFDLPEIVEVTRPLPDLLPDEHWISVLDLSDRLEGFKLFQNQDDILLLPQEELLSEFISVVADPNARLSISDISGASLVDVSPRVPLLGMDASLIVIRPLIDEDDYYMIDTIPLVR